MLPRQNLGAAQQLRTVGQSLQNISMGRRPGINQKFAGHGKAAFYMGRQVWLAFQNLALGQHGNIHDPVLMRLGNQAVQLGQLIIVPRQNHRAACQQRQPKVFPDFKIFAIPACNTRLFKRSGGGVKSGVQDGAVGLGRPVQNIGSLFNHHNPRAIQRKAPRHGTAHHTGPDNRHVKFIIHC